jgi:predicted GNAT family acetyltransferase
MGLFNKKYIFEKYSSESIKISSSKKIIVVNNSKLFKDFFKVNWQVYKNNKYWVPSFYNEMNSFFNKNEYFWTHSDCKLFIAYKDNIPVGRISAFIDLEFIKVNKKNAGFFGFFECINDFEIALNLLDQAQKWIEEKKIHTIIGPIDGRVDIGVGSLIKGFDSTPYLLGHYSQEYYNTFFEKFGMKKLKDLVSYNIELNKKIISDDDFTKCLEKCKKIGVKIRTFNRFQFKKEMNWWIDLFMSEFQDHWGYTSISPEVVNSRFGIKQLRWIVDPPLFLVAEKDNKPIGFRWSLPDYNLIFKKFRGKLGVLELLYLIFNKNKINRGRFIIMGIKKDFRGKGIGTCLNYHTILEMKKRKYQQAEYGWIDEKNVASRRAAEKIGGDLYKIYRVYEKKFNV